MTTFSARRAVLAVTAAAAALTGCSAQPAPGPAAPVTVDPFDQCEPLTHEQILKAADADTLTPHLVPPVCTWNAQRADSETDLTFTFTDTDSLQQIWDQARAQGLHTEHMTVVREALGTTITATGIYVRDPDDPGFCQVSAAVNGSITWQVRNPTHTPTPDPCPIALDLATQTIDLAP